MSEHSRSRGSVKDRRRADAIWEAYDALVLLGESGWHRTQDVAERCRDRSMAQVRDFLFALWLADVVEHQPHHNGHLWRVR